MKDVMDRSSMLAAAKAAYYYRSAVTGRFVTRDFALKHLRTTIKALRPCPRPK